MTADYISIVLYLTWDQPSGYFCIFRTKNKHELKHKKNFNKLAKSNVNKEAWFRCTIYQKIKIQAEKFESILISKLSNFHFKENIYCINTDQFIRIWGEATIEHRHFVKNNLHIGKIREIGDEFLYFDS